MKLTNVTLILTAVFTALMAGFFFSYAVSVSLGLGKLSDKEFLNAMQNINKEVQNPIFFTCFFGALILLLVACFFKPQQTVFYVFTYRNILVFIGCFTGNSFCKRSAEQQIRTFRYFKFDRNNSKANAKCI